MRCSYSCVAGRVFPSPHITVIVGIAVFIFKSNRYRPQLRRVGGVGLINDEEYYLQLRLCFIWVSLRSGMLRLPSVVANIDWPQPLCMCLVIAF